MDPGQLTIGVVGRQDKMKLGQSVRGVGHTVADSRHCDSNSRAKSDCRTLWRQPGRPSGGLSTSSFSQAASPSAKMPGSRRSHEFKVLPGAWAIIERSEVEVLEKQCELLSLILPALGKSLTGTMVGDVQARGRTHLSIVGGAEQVEDTFVPSERSAMGLTSRPLTWTTSKRESWSLVPRRAGMHTEEYVGASPARGAARSSRICDEDQT